MQMTHVSYEQAVIRNRVLIPTNYGSCCFVSFYNLVDQKEHIALVFKQADHFSCPEVRIHSECLTGDIFHSKRCDCGEQLDESLKRFSQSGGIILYLRQEGRGIGLYNKLDAYTLQRQGYDTYEANHALDFADDLRDYTVAAQMLEALGVVKIKLLTNNPQKIKNLEQLGVLVEERMPTGVYVKKSNLAYLEAKRHKSNHWLPNNLQECECHD